MRLPPLRRPDRTRLAVATALAMGTILLPAMIEAASDAGADVTTALDARPPDELIIQAPGASFAIDAREITIANYTLFRAAPAVDVASIKGCAWKTSLGPGPSCAPPPGANPDQPMTCIDWCDAQAFCAAHGKRLCARVGGGAAMTDAERLNPLVDEWSRACGGPMTVDRWPYGSAAMPTACNTAERDAGTTLPTSSLAACTGAPAGLFDMSGNAAEWEDSCVGDAGTGDAAADLCAVRGGSFGDTAENAKCSRIELRVRGDVSEAVGARCCKDLQQ